MSKTKTTEPSFRYYVLIRGVVGPSSTHRSRREAVRKATRLSCMGVRAYVGSDRTIAEEKKALEVAK